MPLDDDKTPRFDDLAPSISGTTDLGPNEVQLALVISRMLDTVADDPDFRRQIVYDLARYKLIEQFTHADAKNVGQMKEALEAAIREVEHFSREQPRIAPAASTRITPLQDFTRQYERRPLPPVPRISNAAQIGQDEAHHGRPLWSVTKGAAIVLLVTAALIGLFTQRQNILFLDRLLPPQRAEGLPSPTPEVVVSTPLPQIVTPSPSPTRALPSDYGVYAATDEQSLAELTALSLRAPDSRVAISPTFKKPDRPILPHAPSKFIVFRRDAANSIPDRIDVRIVAKINRDFSASKMSADAEDAWVVRNLSYPFRASPISGSSEMYELHGEDPELVLPSGHYVLIMKAQAYYFQISGEVTDPRQCVERIVSTNGTFFAPCK